MHESNAKINIWVGAVRSGKTYISLWRFLKELTKDPALNEIREGDFCIITKTYDAFKRNILPLLVNMIGGDARYYAGKREMSIWGKTIHIVGSVDDRAEQKIRGATFAGAYVDETTIIPECIWRMLISRCAMGNARIFATTNPDSPFHWLKRDFIDSNPDVRTWQFNLDDNPMLQDEEKEFLKRQHKGMWYQRFIEGLWVQAQGAIYDFFDANTHVIDYPPGTAEYYLVGVDYGTSNATSFVMVGVNRSKFPNMWVEDVYYYDSALMQRQKTDSEYAADFKKFVAGKNVRAVYIDPSAASFKLELSRTEGVPSLFDAENEVLDGIRLVSKFLSNGTLKICRNCAPLIKEIQSYVWDAKSQRSGKDSPMKVSDHSVDALRYAIYTHFFQDESDRGLSAGDIDRNYRQTKYGDDDLSGPLSNPIGYRW